MNTIQEARPQASEIFIDYALSRVWEDLTDPARRMAAVFLHDSVAVGVAGRNAPFADAVFDVAQSWGLAGAQNGAGVLGRPRARLPAAHAAFVNAFQIHGQEFDCVHEPAVLHPMATIASVVLAQADISPEPIDGRRLLTAICAGVDVAVGLGLAATTPLKFFRPATGGIFGCVAALANLRRLPREAALDAFGYALAFASGAMQAHVEGLPALPLQIAGAARSAMQAVDLAEAGLPGPRGSIDGAYGYLALFEDGSDLAPILAQLAERPRIVEVSWKPFPTGRAAHGAIVATQGLMAQGLSANTLERLVYRAPPLIQRLVGRPATSGMTAAYARLCFPYLGAVTLLRGGVGLDDFTSQRLQDPTTLALAKKIVVEDNGSADPAAFTPAQAVAALIEGRVLQADVDAQLGSPAHPLTAAQHLEKARTCLAFVGLESRHAALAEAFDALELVPDVSTALARALYGLDPMR